MPVAQFPSVIISVLVVVLFTIVIYLGVDKRVQQKKFRIREDAERFKSLYFNNFEAILSFSEKGYLQSCNPAAERLLDYSYEELRELSLVDIVVVEDWKIARSNFIRGLKGEKKQYHIAILTKLGKRIEVEINNIPIVVDNQLVGLYMLAADITSSMQAQNRINYMAYHDALTQLPNRWMFEQKLKQTLEMYANRENDTNKQVVVMFLDLDRFKVINDSFGHEVGDELLRMAATRLSEVVRPGDLVSRIGGDEFTVLLVDIDVNDAAYIAGRIIRAIEQPFDLDNREARVSTSVGIAVFPDHGSDFVSLMRHADSAMYAAKDAGRNGYEFYDAVHEGDSARRLEVEVQLHRALELGELVVFYQPQVAVSSGITIGLEALVRWNHPTRGLLGPGEFISIAEESGLIVRLGEWVMESACRQARLWIDAGYGPLRMSVNVSSRQFWRSDFVSTVSQVLQRTGLEAGYLELEITESMTTDVERAVHVLEQLKRLGVRIAVDDFGTGYSSLNYIRTFPIDSFKIDRTFISEMTDSVAAKAIVSTIISLAKNLNLNVVAEGVETVGQRDALDTDGCDVIQGYFYSAPRSAQDITTNFLLPTITPA